MAYIGQSLTEGTRREYTYVATASQTTFNAIYTVGAVDVYQNGVLLAPSDYTATTGTTVVFNTGAALDDEITIHCHNTFSVADTVSASQGGTFNSDVAVVGDLTVDTNTLFVDSTNNRVGIGTSSPSGPLQVAGGRIKSGILGSSDTSNIGGIDLYATTDNSDRRNWSIKPESTYTGVLGFWVSGTNDSEPSSQMFSLTSSGNAGVKTVPSQWNSGWSAIQVGKSTAIWTTTDSKGATYLTNNIYLDASGQRRYIANGDAAEYSFDGATHYWGRAASGTAGGAVSLVENMRINSTGLLSVGTTSDYGAYINSIATGPLDAWASYATSTGVINHLAFRNPNGFCGAVGTTGTSTYYNTTSDYRLKEDWQPMTGASDRVLTLNPVNFAWKADGSRVDGFLAHEAQAVVPEAVTGEKDAVDADGNPVYQGIDQSKLVPLLTAALQEALTEIAALKDRVAALETQGV